MLSYQVIPTGHAGSFINIFGSCLGQADDKQNLQAVLAQRDGENVGILTFEIFGDACTIYDFFVIEKLRGCGIGSMMYFKLRDYLNYEFTGEIDLQMNLLEENEDFERFLARHSFSKDESKHLRADFLLKDVLESRVLDGVQDHLPQGISIVPLSDLRTPGYLKMLDEVIERCPWYLDKEDIFLHYRADCSMFLIKDSTICGFALVDKINDSAVQLSYLYMDEGSELYLVPLIVSAAQAASRSFGSDTHVHAILSDEEIIKLANRIVPDMKTSPIIRYFQTVEL